jgi:PAS domain S-box-containing protein
MSAGLCCDGQTELLTRPADKVALMTPAASTLASDHPSKAVAHDPQISAPAEATMWDLSVDMMATMSLDGYLIRTNPAWETTLGYAPQELTLRPCLDFVHPDDADQTRVELAAFADPAHQSVRFENRYQAHDGSYRWLSWNSRLGPDGRTIYCVVRDITERLRHEAVIIAQAEDLQRSNRDLEQFAYVASHDLSEPLRSVTGYVQLLARRYRGQLDADADEFIAFAVDGVTRMQALIQDLLAYARAGATKQSVSLDCAALVASLVAAAQEDHPEAVFEVGPMPVVVSEPSPLRQVFDNLVSNALKFVPADRTPHVTISSRSAGPDWEFTVADNGIGIEEHLTERIFGLYQRLHARAAYPGTGIGLAICQRVVERLGGRIWVRSTLGVGSKFIFTVPAAAEPVR